MIYESESSQKSLRLLIDDGAAVRFRAFRILRPGGHEGGACSRIQDGAAMRTPPVNNKKIAAAHSHI